MALLVYVDDIVLASNDRHACDEFKSYLHSCFSIKDLGPLKYFLGIKVAPGPKGLFLSQGKYALEIVHECGILVAKPSHFPMKENHKLSLATGPHFEDAGSYRRLIDLAIGSFGSGSDRVRSVRVMFGLANFGFGSGAVRVEFGSGPVRVD